jgi:hypothetical protein
VDQLYPRAVGSLFVASYDSQGLRWRYSNPQEVLLSFKIQNPSSYLTGNTLRLRYTDKPVNAVYCENRTEHTNTLCGQNIKLQGFLMINDQHVCVTLGDKESMQNRG